MSTQIKLKYDLTWSGDDGDTIQDGDTGYFQNTHKTRKCRVWITEPLAFRPPVWFVDVKANMPSLLLMPSGLYDQTKYYVTDENAAQPGASSQTRGGPYTIILGSRKK